MSEGTPQEQKPPKVKSEGWGIFAIGIFLLIVAGIILRSVTPNVYGMEELIASVIIGLVAIVLIAFGLARAISDKDRENKPPDEPGEG